MLASESRPGLIKVKFGEIARTIFSFAETGEPELSAIVDAFAEKTAREESDARGGAMRWRFGPLDRPLIYINERQR
jgi:hypothetical protein